MHEHKFQSGTIESEIQEIECELGFECPRIGNFASSSDSLVLIQKQKSTDIKCPLPDVKNK
jgi:hypothetical protein